VLSGSRDKKTDHGFVRQYFRALRFYFVTGLLVWVPLIATVWLTWWLFKTVGLGLERLIQNGYGALNHVGERFASLSFLQEIVYVPGFGILIAIALFLTTGFLTRSLVARRLIQTGEKIFDRIPLISKIYRAVQQIRDVFVTREGTVFQKVVLVEYPRKGVWAVGFLTSREKGVVQKVLGSDSWAVFLPSIPNPTTGFLLYVPTGEIRETNLSVEEGMKLIISGGAYQPGNMTPTGDSEPPEKDGPEPDALTGT
jgi:uncharacterized membrane protein